MSIFKDDTTTESALSGIRTKPLYPLRPSDYMLAPPTAIGLIPDVEPFAASAGGDVPPDRYQDKNRMNVANVSRPRRGHAL